MLTTTEKLSLPDSAFLFHLCRHQTVLHRSLSLYITSFNLAEYQPELFQQWQITLPPEIKRSVVKRQAEYLASRYLVYRAAESQGIKPFELKSDPDRVPLWPAALQGSLSHCDGYAVIALTSAKNLIPGVDIERYMADKLAHELQHQIMTPAESDLISQFPLPFSRLVTLIFSAKESLYKALFPTHRQFMDFHSAEVCQLDLNAGVLQLRLTQDTGPVLKQDQRFEVMFCLQPETILTLLAIRNGSRV